MMPWRSLFRMLVLVTLLLATAGERARSDDFPARTITIIVSQAVGGETTFWRGCLPSACRHGSASPWWSRTGSARAG